MNDEKRMVRVLLNYIQKIIDQSKKTQSNIITIHLAKEQNKLKLEIENNLPGDLIEKDSFCVNLLKKMECQLEI